MKRRALERWLNARGGELDREGSRHSWFINRALNRRSAVPRHAEIRDELVCLCRDLGIDPPDHT
jgi:mRNA interferase HicA